MGMRRFTRLTNAFSKRGANLEHAVSLHFMHYNFCRVHMHQTLRVTPAMEAGLTDHVWELGELVALMPKPVAKPWGSIKRARIANAQKGCAFSRDCGCSGTGVRLQRPHPVVQ